MTPEQRRAELLAKAAVHEDVAPRCSREIDAEAHREAAASLKVKAAEIIPASVEALREAMRGLIAWSEQAMESIDDQWGACRSAEQIRRDGDMPLSIEAARAALALSQHDDATVGMDCPVCGGDCGSANPPVMYCPVREPRNATAVGKTPLLRALAAIRALNKSEMEELRVALSATPQDCAQIVERRYETYRVADVDPPRMELKGLADEIRARAALSPPRDATSQFRAEADACPKDDRK